MDGLIHDLTRTLSADWAGQTHWCVVDAGRFQPARFLHAWHTWRQAQADPRRPRLLHFTAFCESPPSLTDQGSNLPSERTTSSLREAFAAQCWGLTPGLHRLTFEGGLVTLTLCVGDAPDLLRELSLTADTLWLDGEGPLGECIKPLSRLCRRGTRLAASSPAPLPPQALQSTGFRMEPGERSGVFDPAWTPKGLRVASGLLPAHCLVIGGGLAGAAVARCLALRGWRVQVLDAAAQPASGASGLPAGLLVPHLSPDDNLLSRLSRAGVRTTVTQAEALLRAGQDWQGQGVLEHRIRRFPATGPGPAGGPGSDEADQAPSAPAGAASAPRARPSRDPFLADEGYPADWSRPATPAEKALAGLAPDAPAVWHGHAAWIKPAELVRAWLDHPGITWRGNTPVGSLEAIARPGGGWRALDALGQELAAAPLVVMAAALGSRALSGGRLWLQPVRGQVSWGLMDEGLDLPACTVNGHGHLLPRVPTAEGPAWMTGATYGRGETDLQARAADHAANLERLEKLLPHAAQALAPAFASGQVRAWTGVRCASHDRRPLVGPLEPGLWVCTAMGSRGLTFAALCAQLLAARLHDEPLPLPLSLAGALDLSRAQRAGLRP